MDRDLTEHAMRPLDGRAEHHDDIRERYLEALAILGDRRILPALHQRLAYARGIERIQLALACRRLGSSGPVLDFAHELERCLLVLPDGVAGDEILNRGVRLLAGVPLPECRRALDRLTVPGHLFHPRARAIILGDVSVKNTAHWWEGPLCLRFLAEMLDDARPTGAVYTVTGGRLCKSWPRGGSNRPLPALLLDPAGREEEAEERHRDLAAETLSYQVAGTPAYHPLLKGSRGRIAALKAHLARFAGRFRKPAGVEKDIFDTSFLPDIRPLGRSATAKDVEEGRAVFHLDGKGRPVSRKLPAVAHLKGNVGLIVQAEEGPGGAAVYGIIFRHSIRRVAAAEVLRVTPLPE
jgi:hypothetical protein